MTRRSSLWYRPWPLVPARILLTDYAYTAILGLVVESLFEGLEMAFLLVGNGGPRTFVAERIVNHKELVRAGCIREQTRDKVVAIFTQEALATFAGSQYLILGHTHNQGHFLGAVPSSARKLYPQEPGRKMDEEYSQCEGFTGFVCDIDRRSREPLMATGFMGHRHITVFAKGQCITPDIWKLLMEEMKKTRTY